MYRPVFLLLAHRLDRLAIGSYRRLAAAVADRAPLEILFHAPDGRLPDGADGLPLWTFSDADLARVGFPLLQERIVPGSTHYPLFLYARSRPGYSHYWVIEYDVRFTGDLRRLFDHFADRDADFLSSHFRRPDEEPGWSWWALEHPRLEIPLPERWRSFNPVYRISAAALEHVESAHRDGWRGHYEVLVPTLLSRAGLSLRDFGGTGSLVAPGDRNRFYVDDMSGDESGGLSRGTMRWRPGFRFPGLRRNVLYHPVRRGL